MGSCSMVETVQLPFETHTVRAGEIAQPLNVGCINNREYAQQLALKTKER